MDSGPLLAWMCGDDQWHEWASGQMALLPQTFITCEPVLTEVCFLAARYGGRPVDVIAKVRLGYLKSDIEIGREAGALETLMTRYADTPMSLADACLVRLSEIHKQCRVFTLDRHFQHYRRYGRSVIPVLSPW